jgi:hypothetical protein
MQIDTNYDAYIARLNNGSVGNKQVQNGEGLVRSSKLNEALSKEEEHLDISNNANLSSRERNFFKNLFPESSLQIENHVLFNRNGKTLNANSFTKGMLVDAAV